MPGYRHRHAHAHAYRLQPAATQAQVAPTPTLQKNMVSVERRTASQHATRAQVRRAHATKSYRRGYVRARSTETNKVAANATLSGGSSTYYSNPVLVVRAFSYGSALRTSDTMSAPPAAAHSLNCQLSAQRRSLPVVASSRVPPCPAHKVTSQNASASSASQ